MNSSNQLPNALIIGAEKAATTWLQHRLGEHPEVFMAPREVHYFSSEKNYHKGQDWYASHFSQAGDVKIRCEKTPAYLCRAIEGVDTAQRIASLLPSIKLMIVLRDPVERAISSWNYYRLMGRIAPNAKLDINDILEPSASEFVNACGILRRGLYHSQIDIFLKHFSQEQICVLFYETDIKQEEKSALRKVCTFLGINTEAAFREKQRENRAAGTRLYVWGNHMLRGIPRHGWRSFPHRYWRTLEKHCFTLLPLKKWQYVRPEEQVLQDMYAFYAEENMRLEELIGSIPASWRGAKKACNV